MSERYLGRIVAAAVTPSGRAAAMYRVSSRSFPNRMAVVSSGGRGVSIIPKPGHGQDISRNPYIAYNAARLVGNYAILTNGSHTDPIAEKVGMGMPVRDALVVSLLAMDYEKDDYDTPRIAVVSDAASRTVWLGTVRRDGLDVRSFVLEPGQMIHLSTYEDVLPASHLISEVDVDGVEELCDFAISGGVFADFTNPVTSVAAVADAGEFRLAVKDL